MMDNLTTKDVNVAAPSTTDLWLCTLIGLGITGLIFVITDFYTSTRFRPVKTIAQASVTGHATNIIQGLAQGLQSTAAPALLIALGILGANELAGHLRHRRRGDGAALDDRPDRRARRLRADHRQRGRHRRDGGPARGRAQRHRPARRGREHHQGGHEGLRDRLGRARRARAVRELARGAGRRGRRQGGEVVRPRDARGADRPAARRHDGLPVRLVRDRGGRPRRRPGRRGGAAPVPREAGHHGRHREARLRRPAWRS